MIKKISRFIYTHAVHVHVQLEVQIYRTLNSSQEKKSKEFDLKIVQDELCSFSGETWSYKKSHLQLMRDFDSKWARAPIVSSSILVRLLSGSLSNLNLRVVRASFFYL